MSSSLITKVRSSFGTSCFKNKQFKKKKKKKKKGAPLDLETDAFYLVRRQEIEKRIEEISRGKVSDLITKIYKENMGASCIGVNWNRYTSSLLIEVSEALGFQQLASLCRYLAEDYRHRCSGLPDLFVWQTDPPRCKLVEVKGPNDRLLAPFVLPES